MNSCRQLLSFALFFFALNPTKVHSAGEQLNAEAFPGAAGEENGGLLIRDFTVASAYPVGGTYQPTGADPTDDEARNGFGAGQCSVSLAGTL